MNEPSEFERLKFYCKFYPDQEILVLIAYAQMPLINAHPDVSGENIDLNFVGAFIYNHTFVYVSSKGFVHTVKLALSSHSKRRPKLIFPHRLSLNAGQKYCRMLHESLRHLLCLFMSGRLRQVLLYAQTGLILHCLTM